jgi:hypothetical protein
MANFTNIPFLTPIKFYKNGNTGIHLDDSFSYNQIKSFQTKVCYKYKWQIGDITPIQITSTVAPSPVLVYSGDGNLVTGISFAWTMVGTGGALGINLFECVINLGTLPTDKTYFLYFKAELLSYKAEFVSEPIFVKTLHDNTLGFKYRNSVNKLGVYFSTGIEYLFRCEAGIMEYLPEIEGFDYVDQIRNAKILEGVPYDSFKLYIGKAPGVADYIIKILNYIFACDHVEIEGMQYVKSVGEKWEPTRAKGYPQAGWATTITPAINMSSLQFNDNGNPLTPGIVTAYNIDTNLFSDEPITTIQIIEITTT